MSHSNANKIAVEAAPGIFGIPLGISIKYANVAISLTNDQGESFIYGYVPIVVAKCGVYLKEKGKLCSPDICYPSDLLTQPPMWRASSD